MIEIIVLLAFVFIFGITAWCDDLKDLEAERAVLLKTDLEFSKVTEEKGLEGWLSFFAEDASIFPVNGPIITGLGPIREYYEKTKFSPEGLTWKPIKAEIATSGDLGHTFGYWELKRTNPQGEQETVRGKYVTIWRKQADSSWKLVVDIGNK